MYICPTCNRQFNREEDVAAHFLKCWKDKNPNHKSKPAPRSDDIINRQMDDSIASFFEGLQLCKK